MQVNGDPEAWFPPASVAGNRFCLGLRFIWYWFLLTDSDRFGKTKVGSIEAFVDPPAPQGLQLLVERRSALITGAAPVGADAVPTQQTVLILSESRQRHVEDARSSVRPVSAGRAKTFLIADCGLRIADCGLRTADCGLRTADCGLWIADCGLRIADCGLRISRVTRGFYRQDAKFAKTRRSTWSTIFSPSSSRSVPSVVAIFLFTRRGTGGP
jgi:hypothetical protein